MLEHEFGDKNSRPRSYFSQYRQSLLSGYSPLHLPDSSKTIFPVVNSQRPTVELDNAKKVTIPILCCLPIAAMLITSADAQRAGNRLATLSDTLGVSEYKLKECFSRLDLRGKNRQAAGSGAMIEPLALCLQEENNTITKAQLEAMFKRRR
ncbi:hypothetical protein E1162_04765 [Rhodobacteraceae bacterium RKSG542]|uniref:hypothetical protein n=1 Tax=Pseudovibrio flavus TaxID=2529854 RepID=UPI00211CAB82|nr:hypothetical protein [Pseudovibrio flavus]MTI16549.1 hypothetical protein [Pseudovibrio flavus]